MTMLVRAKEFGVIKSSRVRAGTVFEYELEEGGSLPSFLVPADTPIEPPAPLPTELGGRKLEYPKTAHEHVASAQARVKK
jgi:hypothetical protein